MFIRSAPVQPAGRMQTGYRKIKTNEILYTPITFCTDLFYCSNQ